MDMRLLERFTELEAQRTRAVAAVATLPETDRALPMAGSAWSPAQVLAHCAMAEQDFVRRIAMAAETGTAGLRPTRSPLLPIALLAGRHPIAALPVPEGMVPAADVSLESAARNWELVRSDLRGWLESVEDPDRGVWMIHPILGPMSATQVLSVLEAHGCYHAKRHFDRLAARRGT